MREDVHCHVHKSSPSVCIPMQIKSIHTPPHHIHLESFWLFSSHILLPKSAKCFLPFTASNYPYILFPLYSTFTFFYSSPSILHIHSFIHSSIYHRQLTTSLNTTLLYLSSLLYTLPVHRFSFPCISWPKQHFWTLLIMKPLITQFTASTC